MFNIHYTGVQNKPKPLNSLCCIYMKLPIRNKHLSFLILFHTQYVQCVLFFHIFDILTMNFCSSHCPMTLSYIFEFMFSFVYIFIIPLKYIGCRRQSYKIYNIVIFHNLPSVHLLLRILL